MNGSDWVDKAAAKCFRKVLQLTNRQYKKRKKKKEEAVDSFQNCAPAEHSGERSSGNCPQLLFFFFSFSFASLLLLLFLFLPEYLSPAPVLQAISRVWNCSANRASDITCSQPASDAPYEAISCPDGLPSGSWPGQQAPRSGAIDIFMAVSGALLGLLLLLELPAWTHPFWDKMFGLSSLH